MPLFVLFVFGAVMLGAGALFSPALPTAQPRIGLAAALTLALILGGSLFWLALFGGALLVVDYVLFALLSTIVLGGTLSQAQMRAEAQGLELPDTEQGWPGPQDLAFFGLVAALLTALLLVVRPAALDGTYAPGWELLTSYLGQQLDQPRPVIQMSVGAVVGLLIVWAGYDLGGELRAKTFGRTLALPLLAGVIGLYLSGGLTLLLGLLFVVTLAAFLLRVVRQYHRWDVLVAGLMLGAALHAGTTALAAACGLYVLAVGGGLVRPAGYPLRRRALALLLIPLIAVLATLPTFARSVYHLRVYGTGLQPDGLLLLALIGMGALIGGWGLLVLWQALPGDLRATLRHRYPFAAAAGGVVVLAALLLLSGR